MKVQELIDKIQEIKREASSLLSPDNTDADNTLKFIIRICDNILIDWKMENAKCLSLMNSSEKH